jgi:phenylalanyl-tRNA synthetase alpha chain
VSSPAAALAALCAEFDQQTDAVSDKDGLVRLRAAFLGRKGRVTRFRSTIDFRALSSDDKRELGQALNRTKTHVEAGLAAVEERLAAAEAARPELDFDLTLPGEGSSVGGLHPITLMQAEVAEIFRGMGFRVFEGDHAVSEFENFDALNIPGDHPARDMQDTFWLENGMVLRTHTSSMQNRAMRELGVPLRAIFPGRTFRNEATDTTHENTFYQLEGMFIDEHVTVSNLIAVMRELLSQVFQRDVEVRLRPGFFPFVEPGFELDFRADLGKGWRWIELMPCGMIHPFVLRSAGVDPERYSGFAFGLGLTRLAMLKFGIPDVRLLNKGDLRFAEQFRATL